MAAIRVLLLLAVLLGVVWVASPPGAPAATAEAQPRSPDGLQWPQRRFAPCAAFDDRRGAWYVFGGRGEGGAVHHADAWRLAVRRPAPRWRRVADAGAAEAPPPLRSCAAAYDSHNGRMLVFGGWDGITPTNGVWALTAAGRWQRLCDLACGAPPTARRASQAVYDPIGRRLLVFGGLDAQYRNDMWELALDGAPAWRRLSPAGPLPAPRGGHSLVYDRERHRAWLFGGTTSGPDLGDTWTFDLATETWSPAECSADCPAPRSGAVLVHDVRAGRLVLHGGWESGPNRYPRDIWTLEDLGDTPDWERAHPDSDAPQRRYFGVGAYDRKTRRLLAFGGGVGATALKDVAALELGARLAWGGLAPRAPLTARDQVAVGMSERGDRLLAFGGFGSGTFPGQVDAGTHLADTWSLGLSGDSGRWRNVTPPSGAPNPLHREAAAVATDTRRDRLVMVGGLEGDDELADVWAADLKPGPARWRQVCSPTSCGAGPEARWGAHAVFDPVGDRIVVFGGRQTNGTSYGDAWTLSLGRDPHWTRLEPSGDGPAPRWGGAAGYDPAGRRMVVTGGQTGSDGNADSHADTWALSLDGTPEWRRLTPEGPEPEPRRSPGYAMRTTGGSVQLIVAGGLDAETGVHFNDVWTLTLTGDDAAWSQLAQSDCTSAPACRRSASAAYDARRDRLLLIFGRDRERFYADAWTFGLRDRQWRPFSA